jgi:hypothetical protein
MKMPLTNIFQRFSILSGLSNEEDRQTSILYNKGSNPLVMTSADISNSLNEPSPCRIALDAFLEELPPYVVATMMTIMYIGRENDGSDDPYNYWIYLKQTIDSKYGWIDSLSSKAPRWEYIEKGIEYVGEMTIIEDLCSKIKTDFESENHSS